MDVTADRRVDLSAAVSVGKSIYSLVIVLVLWELVAQFGLIHYYFLPPLSDILLRFYELTVSGEMLYNAYLTLRRALVGLAIASVLGIVVGILCARNAAVNWFFDPIIKIGYPVPIISLIPVFMLWFGIGDVSKIIMVAVGTFWPVAVNARDSTRQVEQNLVWSARMMGTGNGRLLRRVILPAAAPGILTGLQIAMPLSLIITFVFEMVAGGGGLGALEIEGVRSFESTQVYAAIIAIMLVGIGLDRILRFARGRLLHWT
ncbi:ABC transporter permease [Halorarum halophilum]|uniref:ABC transporter permease n=1 Tax=Halorarum halophilum TaxID=2743090 RepID=A0A7D5K976_9EURY|nr:ABC transporter permease [Halobaculum halophilum]QLG28794.1 ABC transporter permease [Halobaculum halophilum]